MATIPEVCRDLLKVYGEQNNKDDGFAARSKAFYSRLDKQPPHLNALILNSEEYLGKDKDALENFCKEFLEAIKDGEFDAGVTSVQEPPSTHITEPDEPERFDPLTPDEEEADPEEAFMEETEPAEELLPEDNEQRLEEGGIAKVAEVIDDGEPKGPPPSNDPAALFAAAFQQMGGGGLDEKAVRKIVREEIKKIELFSSVKIKL